MIFSRHANSAAVSLLAATSYYFFVSSSSSSSSYASQSHVAAGAVVTTITDEEVIDAADAGILAVQVPPSSSSSVDQDNTIGTIIGRGLQATTNYCTDGYVDCTAGVVTGDPNQTPCHQACYDNDLPGYRCCGGTKACDLFTGKICKDKYSCMGTEACYDATIPIVVKSCNGGDKACWKVGRIPGCAANKVGNFINSCIGEKSCYQVAYGDRAGSGVGNLINSCTADEACRDMGRDGKGGIITSDLKDCCTTGRSCFEYGEFNIPDVCKAATVSFFSPPSFQHSPHSFVLCMPVHVARHLFLHDRTGY